MRLSVESMPTSISTFDRLKSEQLVELGGQTVILPETQFVKFTARFADDEVFVPQLNDERLFNAELINYSGNQLVHDVGMRATDYLVDVYDNFNVWDGIRKVSIDDEGEKLFDSERAVEPPTEVIEAIATQGDLIAKVHLYNFTKPLSMQELANFSSIVQKTIKPFQTGLPPADSYVLVFDSLIDSSFIITEEPFILSSDLLKVSAEELTDLEKDILLNAMARILFKYATGQKNKISGNYRLHFERHGPPKSWGIKKLLGVDIEDVASEKLDKSA